MKINLFFKIFLLIHLSNVICAQSVIQNSEEAETTIISAEDDLSKFNYKSSLEKSQKVLQYAFKINDYELIANTYIVIGNNYSEFSDYKKALYFYKEGVKYAKKKKTFL